MKKSERNYFIDLLKSIFSIIIVIFHGRVFSEHLGFFSYGFLAVDFYFIVTGYLMMHSLEKDKIKDSISKKSYLFLKSKLASIYPYIFFAFLLGTLFVFRQLSSFKLIVSNSYLFLELLQLSSLTGVSLINGASWYISAMLLALFVLYPLALKFKEKYLNIIIPFLLLFFLALVYHFKIPITDPYVSNFFLINGLYKAFIFILLGNISFILTKFITKIKFTTLGKIVISFTEIILYLILILNMHYYYFANELSAIFFIFAVAISFSNKTYSYNLLNYRIFQKFSSFSFILYLNHIYLRTYIFDHYMHLTYRGLLIRYFALALLISIFMYIFVPLIVKMFSTVLNFFRNKLTID